MEIARAADFVGAMLRKEGLKQATYTLSEQESLGNGDYYWRVRAVDGAGNQGAWSTGQYFIVGGVQVWHIIAAILAVLILFGIIWRVVRISKKGGWKS
jgi:predicted phage tail protein